MSADLPPDDWPGRAYSRIVPCKPHRWHVQSVGSGPDILLLHGAGASTHSWARLTPILAKNYRVIAVDLPGHGYTRSPRGRSRLCDVAQDVAALTRQEGWHPRVVVGHSAGAAVALEMARTGALDPDRIVAINGALEDFKGPAGWLFPMMAKMLALNPLTGIFITQDNPSRAQVRRIIGATGADLDDTAIDLYARLIQRKSHVEGTLAMMAQWSLRDLNHALPEITTPTLFLHGERDGAVDIRVAERAASVMPDARLERFVGIGHLAQEEAPDLVAGHIHAFAEAIAAE